jgi:hypothetical protein
VIRPIAAAAALLLLAACSQGGAKTDATDLNASLGPEILKWKADIEASHPTCKAKVDGKGCEGFEVTCKGARELSPGDQAKGVTDKVVASMVFSAKAADGSTGKLGSAFAEFSRGADGQWTRSTAMPVNPTTCAPL